MSASNGTKRGRPSGAVSYERTCERCGASLEGRRPDARFCSPACRRAGARQRDARRAPLAADPAQNPGDRGACRAHACEAALRCLEERLDALAGQLSDADARLMARVMRGALRDGRER